MSIKIPLTSSTNKRKIINKIFGQKKNKKTKSILI